jgi:hypothetical protein
MLVIFVFNLYIYCGSLFFVNLFDLLLIVLCCGFVFSPIVLIVATAAQYAMSWSLSMSSQLFNCFGRIFEFICCTILLN